MTGNKYNHLDALGGIKQRPFAPPPPVADDYDAAIVMREVFGHGWQKMEHATEIQRSVRTAIRKLDAIRLRRKPKAKP
jgi:hypothetical protein